MKNKTSEQSSGSTTSEQKLQSIRLSKAIRIPGGNNTQGYFEVGQIGDSRCDDIVLDRDGGIVTITKGKFTRCTTALNCYELTPFTGEPTTPMAAPAALGGPPGLPGRVVAGDPDRP